MGNACHIICGACHWHLVCKNEWIDDKVWNLYSTSSNSPVLCLAFDSAFSNKPPDYYLDVMMRLNSSNGDIVLGLLGEIKCGFSLPVVQASFHPFLFHVDFLYPIRFIWWYHIINHGNGNKGHDAIIIFIIWKPNRFLKCACILLTWKCERERLKERLY